MADEGTSSDTTTGRDGDIVRPLDKAASRRSSPEARYPNVYVWFVLMSAMDIFLTYIVLWLGGSEVNQIANKVLQTFGFTGMIVFKFVLVILVIGICEIIGRHNDATGRRLAEWAVAITCIPVVYTSVMLGLNVIVN